MKRSSGNLLNEQDFQFDISVCFEAFRLDMLNPHDVFMTENMKRKQVALGGLSCYFPWLSNSWRRTADQGIERMGPPRLKTLRCLLRTVIWGLTVISPSSCGVAWERMRRPREALTLQTEFFLRVSVFGHQPRPIRPATAQICCGEMAFIKINFLGKNTSFNEQSDFD